MLDKFSSETLHSFMYMFVCSLTYLVIMLSRYVCWIKQETPISRNAGLCTITFMHLYELRSYGWDWCKGEVMVRALGEWEIEKK